jgi:hypothetical protein
MGEQLPPLDRSLVCPTLPKVWTNRECTVAVNGESPLGELEGSFTALEVAFTVPAAWFADTTLVLRVYGEYDAGGCLIQEVLFSNLRVQSVSSGQQVNGFLRVKAQSCRGFRLVAATPRGALSGSAIFVLMGWGSEPADFEVAGESPRLGMSEGPFSPRASVTMGLATEDNRNRSVTSTNNRLNVNALVSPAPPPASFRSSVSTASAATMNGTAGKVVSLVGGNMSAGALFFGVVDKASAPVNGDSFLHSWVVPPGGSFNKSFAFDGLAVAAGKSFAWSTTGGVVALPTPDFSGVASMEWS